PESLDEGHVVRQLPRGHTPPPSRVAKGDDAREHPSLVRRHAETRKDLRLMPREATHWDAAEPVRPRGELKTPHGRIDRSAGPDRVLPRLDEGCDEERDLGEVRGQVKHGPHER